MKKRPPDTVSPFQFRQIRQINRYIDFDEKLFGRVSNGPIRVHMPRVPADTSSPLFPISLAFNRERQPGLFTPPRKGYDRGNGCCAQ